MSLCTQIFNADTAYGMIISCPLTCSEQHYGILRFEVKLGNLVNSTQSLLIVPRKYKDVATIQQHNVMQSLYPHNQLQSNYVELCRARTLHYVQQTLIILSLAHWWVEPETK